jgi:hypothetical protein
MELDSLTLKRLRSVRYDMVRRCHKPTDPHFKWYGARGIAVCDEWRHDSDAFIAWAVANGYQQGLEIDRRNNDLGYTPDNCRWVSRRVNTLNRRGRLNSTSAFKGVSRCNRNKPRPWKVGLRVGGKDIHGGYFATQEEAARRYDELVRLHISGTDCAINFPQESQCVS